jgi:hypothetical protein
VNNLNYIKDNKIQVWVRKPRISNIASPDDTKIYFSHTTATGVELWVIEVSFSQKLTEAMVNANIGNPFSWLNDNATNKMLPKTERLYWIKKRFTNWSDYFEC